MIFLKNKWNKIKNKKMIFNKNNKSNNSNNNRL